MVELIHLLQLKKYFTHLYNALYSENRSLFDQLLRTGKQLDIDFYNTIANRYKNGTGYTALDINKEFVTQMLQRAVKQEFKENETRPANQFTQYDGAVLWLVKEPYF